MTGPVTLVTGGSRGLGRAIVRLLAAEGRQVVFTYRADAAAARLVEEACEGRARAVALDVADRDASDAAVRHIEATIGPIEGLVCNAGVSFSGLAAMTPDREWDHTIDVNLGGAFRTCRAVLGPMVHRRHGAIVLMSSLAAVAGTPGQAAYAASKAALLGLSRTVAREVGRRHIRVNVVVPGFVATDMTAGLGPQDVQRLRSHECLPTGTSPLDVAHAVSFLLSDRSAAITGQC
ncbi:MAG: SDR family oxidoreductase, partial [Acidobacteria bacterium]|nr:SDR family oxidoreductase [Acidobacteriota bacterium]